MVYKDIHRLPDGVDASRKNCG